MQIIVAAPISPSDLSLYYEPRQSEGYLNFQAQMQYVVATWLR